MSGTKRNSTKTQSLSGSNQTDVVVVVLIAVVDETIFEDDVPRLKGIAGIGRRRPIDTRWWCVGKSSNIDGRALVVDVTKATAIGISHILTIGAR